MSRANSHQKRSQDAEGSETNERQPRLAIRTSDRSVHEQSYNLEKRIDVRPRLASIYSWIVYHHILSILGFLAAHGVTIGTVFKPRRQNDPEETKTLLNLSRESLRLAGAALITTLITGIALGFMGNWWSQL